MKFIGLIASEEASAAFFDSDTGTLLAASEERFTRLKGQTGFPSNAINWLLKESNSSHDEIDVVLYCHSESVLPGNISSDVLKIEHLLLPGTLILWDGQTNNARFTQTNLQRKWKNTHLFKQDISISEQIEEPLGPYNKRQLKFSK